MGRLRRGESFSLLFYMENDSGPSRTPASGTMPVVGITYLQGKAIHEGPWHDCPNAQVPLRSSVASQDGDADVRVCFSFFFDIHLYVITSFILQLFSSMTELEHMQQKSPF